MLEQKLKEATQTTMENKEIADKRTQREKTPRPSNQRPSSPRQSPRRRKRPRRPQRHTALPACPEVHIPAFLATAGAAQPPPTTTTVEETLDRCEPRIRELLETQGRVTEAAESHLRRSYGVSEEDLEERIQQLKDRLYWQSQGWGDVAAYILYSAVSCFECVCMSLAERAR
ncbi:unnamed protein product [Vitrella brassicaformis CCMP3155]|uniref:Uncharacterized protein n=1 Tax=Vitrella brassicaformis (strain CCMP3155) TaxID=1169540 RepID=A0A0G4EGE3_VITBC|nr:unnamed protein product [Vitrella brassicaformis CCMP3155]|eukprot:CEL94792.1 unnamed protein product [Vitrella brassicaformis CCMP3155]